jgi:hypothetical protein
MFAAEVQQQFINGGELKYSLLESHDFIPLSCFSTLGEGRG